MKSATEELQIVNIDTANEEIQRLAKRLGQPAPDFVPNIYDANSKIQELEAELAKRKTASVAETSVAPKPTPTTVTPPTRKIAQGTGLMRAINSNIIAQGGTPIVTRSEEKAEVTGLQRSINAAIAAQKSKSK